MNLQVVWFKRDLRTIDNQALAAASKAGPVLCVYVLESEYWQLPDTSNRQWQFVRESLVDLQEQLHKLGGALWITQGDVVETLTRLKHRFGAFTLHSHEEQGNAWTFARDRAVKRWCVANQVRWHEYAQFGVVRPVKQREGQFHEHWFTYMSEPQAELPREINFVTFEVPSIYLPFDVTQDEYPCLKRQSGGRTQALATLTSFLTRRSERYRGSISSPLTAPAACSRLSPYLAYGCISLKELVQQTNAAQERTVNSYWRRSLNDFAKRLWWHCYFMQRFESHCYMENRPLVPQMAQLEPEFDAIKFDAWKHGRTGWPMVDACMRYLHHHGWINFRMRAMLVSAATYSLGLPWQPVAQWLAKLFVDYEPGIHYPQVQMQSGQASNSILRIYNPVHQAQRLDPDGLFVKRWIPELQHIEGAWLFEPWQMPNNLRRQAGWNEQYFYPTPLVDFEQSHRQIKAAIAELRQRYNLHPADRNKERRRLPASRKKHRTKSQLADNQLSLF
ncbi:deoxyribodipyrimidine photo-lyase [Pseudidiomarina maritima]|uniref:Deoxyribodipyrimidine photo-lyase n=1 Tax=Pseudidiomarina maritima TaxID=519453 RepID=A0A1I6G9K9_9GAMM|nr:FAD-binding domain-containing protein [Pseudidiomarina maritima]SFR38821.1 deoxyribodipyrimidine photo-lyase [Pseudidiomarina maritima]